MSEQQAEERAEVEEVFVRGVHPTWHDMERAEIIAEAKKLPVITPVIARLIVALEDAHERLAKIERSRGVLR